MESGRRGKYPKLGECRIMEGITAAELYGKAIAGNNN